MNDAEKKAAELAFYSANLPIAQSAKDDHVVNDTERTEELTPSQQRAIKMKDEVNSMYQERITELLSQVDGSIFDEQENAPLFKGNSHD